MFNFLKSKKPQYIILVRHAQSIGNVDKTIYATIPDHALILTPKGLGQALHRGGELSNFLIEKNIKNVNFYVSTYHRTILTYREIATQLISNNILYNTQYSPLLREQELSNGVFPGDLLKVHKEKDKISQFYYRFGGGESCADVYNRQALFLNDLFSQFQKGFPKACIIVGHGMQLRVLLMRFFHMSVEDFELLKNPQNCCQIILKLQKSGNYTIMGELEKYEKPTHPYQLPL